MLRKRFTPSLTPNDDICNPTGNTLTLVRLEALNKFISEYKEAVKIIVSDENLIAKMVVEALVLYYKWNLDFIDHGLSDLPKESDLNTNEELKAREVLLECIIGAMHDIDLYHPELRIICKNAQSVSVVNVRKFIILLSLNIYNGTLH